MPTGRARESGGARSRSELSSLRVLLVHDWIIAWGGAERTVEQMLEVFPSADLVVGVMGDGRRGLNAVTQRARETWLAHVPGARAHHRWFLPLYSAAFRSIDTSGYDLVISSSSAFSKSIRVRPGTPHLCYCYTPPRYLWDMQSEYGRNGSPAGYALALAGPVLRALDKASARGVTRFVGISHHIKRRIARAYGRDAGVVYPPVSAKPCTIQSSLRTDQFLSLGRLVPYKRVDLAILAANRTGAALIVAGDGPERQRLQSIAGSTVSFVGEVTETEAGNLMESCKAMIFCAEEDFGIAPVEANAHGLPVIAYGRGAALETLQDGVTGVFFAEPTVDSVAGAMRRFDAASWDEAVLRSNARRFSPDIFRSRLAEVALELLSATNGVGQRNARY